MIQSIFSVTPHGMVYNLVTVHCSPLHINKDFLDVYVFQYKYTYYFIYNAFISLFLIQTCVGANVYFVQKFKTILDRKIFRMTKNEMYFSKRLGQGVQISEELTGL